MKTLRPRSAFRCFDRTQRLVTPLAIQPANLLLWLRADKNVTPATDGADVDSWQDWRGNAITFSQATATKKPWFVASEPTLGGKPALNWGGDTTVDDALTTTGTIKGSASEYTFFAAVSPDAGSNSYLFDSDASGADRLILYYNAAPPDPSPSYHDGADRGTVGWVGTGGQFVTWILDSPTGGTFRKNGVQIETGLGYTSRSLQTQTALGAFSAGTGSYFDGKIAEFIVYDAVLSLPQVQAIENYLKTRYVL